VSEWAAKDVSGGEESNNHCMMRDNIPEMSLTFLDIFLISSSIVLIDFEYGPMPFGQSNNK
jgi:hypothetical protein